MNKSIKKIILLTAVICLSVVNVLSQEADSAKNENIERQINLSELGQNIHFNKDEIRLLPFRNLNSFGLASPSAYYLKDHKLYYYGIKSYQNNYYIDGLQLNEAVDFPIGSIGNYTLHTNNIPIQRGFSLIGITDIKTPDVGRKPDFNVTIYTDQAKGLQTYNAEFSVGIPLASKQQIASGKPLASIFISGKYNTTNNTDPVWKTNKKLKADVLANLEQNPLRSTGLGSGVFENAAYVNEEDFIGDFTPDNAGKNGWDLYAKLNIPLFKGASVQLGNYTTSSSSDVYLFDNSVFNANNNQIHTNKNINSYLQFSHDIQLADEVFLKYNLQFQYSTTNSKTESEQHKDNFFEYGYLGKFTTYKKPTFELGSDSVNGEYYQHVWIQNSWDYDTLVTWDPGSVNPGLAAYTNNYYEIYSGFPEGNYQNLSQIILNGGLINGSRPYKVYNLINNTGYQVNNYQKSENNKIRGSLNFDLKWQNHTITFGGEYNRDESRSYSLKPDGLWTLIRGLANYHILELDKDHPIAISHEGEVDTIMYYRKYNEESQKEFDKNLRKTLGLPVDGLEYIITDSYDMEKHTISYYDKNGVMHTISAPENLYQLSMFSPLELLNQGFSYVSYAGYDYTGNRQTYNSDPYAFYSDFSINASRAEYGSAYLQDEYKWKNLNVRIGVRMDIYNADRPVLKDSYSLFPIYSIDEVIANNLLEITKPENLSGDAYVYVDNPYYPTEVVGFRENNKWYDKYGDEPDHIDLILYGGHGPFLKYPDIDELSDENWEPEMTFRLSKSVVNFLPQINIDYTIKDLINLYVNYNSSTQNPIYINDFRPDLYYYWNSYAGENTIFTNPGLKPMRSGKLFAGIKGILYKNLVADLAFLMTTIDNYFYVDLIEYAYPKEYYSVMNSENRISTEGFSASVNYVNPTLSGFEGGINFTKLFPKETDVNYFQVSDMVLNARLGYRFGRNENYKGPFLGKTGILQGFSANLFYQFRKGTPYYRTKHNILIEGIAKSPNFNLINLNIQKDFQIGNKAMINIYLTVENLLNTKNSFEVYSDTGSPDDDGFLSDPANQNLIEAQLSPDTYRLLYQMHLNDPSHFDIPRIWRIGLVFSY